MANRVYNVLFACTGNSSRSVFAEAIMNQPGQGKFRAWSAGSHPTGNINPYTIETLRRLNLPTEGYASKNWEVFTRPGAPVFDFVFMVCDSAAGEVCPIWPGPPFTAHWGVEDPAPAEACPFWPGAPVQAHWEYPDPSRVEGTEAERQRAFELTRQALAYKITQLPFLPLDVMDDQDLQRMPQTVSES